MEKRPFGVFAYGITDAPGLLWVRSDAGQQATQAASIHSQLRKGIIMDVIELLINDHRRIEKLLAQLGSAGAKEITDRAELFEELKGELDCYAENEQMIFYPVILEADETYEIALEGYEELFVIQDILVEMESVDVDSPEWKANFLLLKEKVELHFKEENEEIFPKALQELSRSQLLELGKRIKVNREGFFWRQLPESGQEIPDARR
ncbi:hypothetical protein CAP31_06210 [Sulfuriferula sp. AH1]|uniref:hemerythrin domain-containing protein n=1 Tax=Sulfuriferula sp. AH1 TaxID=1985873 RepID=UPI000B3B18D1|nr:hemerythrin domain-containing protein [Sulfuriferula sp. AH1]ARU31313.1 hypothetical protein CAP31_06210 [Sulfuriferula sp. AH1]